jgi:hypothetical protein
LDGDAAFVDEAMMEAAKRHEIRKFRLSAVSPMFDVVTIDVFLVAAAGEAAALVA